MPYTLPMPTADILQAFEPCRRKGVWTQDWEANRIHPTKMVQMALRAALTETEREDYAELAGETVMQLAAERGMETKVHNRYDSCLHHATLADILASHLRKPGEAPWTVPEAVDVAGTPWTSSALLSASGKLTRIVLTSGWDDDKHLSEYRSWQTLGEVVAYQMPMTQIVIILGASRDGKRHSPWSKGLLHPSNRVLRFRKRNNKTTTGFNSSWIPVWREEQDQISRETWLKAMDEDGVLEEVAFQVQVQVPSPATSARIREMMSRHVEALAAMETVPGPQLSTCDVPPCQFRSCCPEGEPSEGAFVRIR